MDRWWVAIVSDFHQSHFSSSLALGSRCSGSLDGASYVHVPSLVWAGLLRGFQGHNLPGNGNSTFSESFFLGKVLFLWISEERTREVRHSKRLPRVNWDNDRYRAVTLLCLIFHTKSSLDNFFFVVSTQFISIFNHICLDRVFLRKWTCWESFSNKCVMRLFE